MGHRNTLGDISHGVKHCEDWTSGFPIGQATARLGKVEGRRFDLAIAKGVSLQRVQSRFRERSVVSNNPQRRRDIAVSFPEREEISRALAIRESVRPPVGDLGLSRRPSAVKSHVINT